ncbi:MAG TPA: hypothetical protein VKR06_03840 [Ktedonosporobacter sp.]|nr:hypothetical protein [Ktedonosporobacter sp.]
MGTTQIRRQPKPVHYDVEDEDAFYSTRPNTSTRRYRTAPPIPHDTLDEPIIQEGKLRQRRASMKITSTNGMEASTIMPPNTETLQRPRRFSPVAVCIGMFITIILLIGISSLLSWWQTYQDDIHYGRPRTFQMDAVVGHNDSEKNPTHFIFLNLNRHVEVIEIPGGDASHTRVYTGPVLFGDGQDLTPVTGEIRDENGHKDLIIHIQNQQIVLVNDGTSFHPQ